MKKAFILTATMAALLPAFATAQEEKACSWRIIVSNSDKQSGDCDEQLRNVG